MQKSVFLLLGLAVLVPTGVSACDGGDATTPQTPPSDEGGSDGGHATSSDAAIDATSLGDDGGVAEASIDAADADADSDSGLDSGPLPPSCAPGGAGMTDCGGDAGESCCTSLEVTSGSYSRTYTSSADGGTSEADPANVSGFRLDKYLVTVGRFRQFVDAVLLPDGGLSWTPPAGSGKHTHLNGGQGLAAAPNVDAGQTYEPGWSGTTSDNAAIAPTNTNLACGAPYDTWTNSPGSPQNQENLPINCVTWQEAYAFCIWDGGFLPSEAEWEYAAAGGSEQLEYPWGTTAPGTGNQYAIYDFNYTGSSTGIAPVGFASLGVGRWGQLDLAGDLFEWNLDWYASIYADPCTDCVQLNPSSSNRVIRGGGFNSSAASLLPANGDYYVPTVRAYLGGLRCARTP